MIPLANLLASKFRKPCGYRAIRYNCCQTFTWSSPPGTGGLLMTRLRTFIAVDPGKAVRSRCVSLQETLAKSAERVRWEKPENIHVTLLFLGDVDERDLLPVCEAVSAVCARQDAFAFSAEGVGCFPNLHRPRTIWAGIGTGAAE